MKRRTDMRRRPSEIKADSQRCYGEMTECTSSQKVRKSFERPASSSQVDPEAGREPTRNTG